MSIEKQTALRDRYNCCSIGITYLKFDGNKSQFRLDLQLQGNIYRQDIQISQDWDIKELFTQYPQLNRQRIDLNLIVESINRDFDSAEALRDRVCFKVISSMGACMVAGYNNWDRIRKYREGRKGWSEENQNNFEETAKKQESLGLIPPKNLYQDRFIILSDGFYSNVAPENLGLTESEWRKLSLTIRLEHECTHYFTRRLFNSMQNNLLDELIADYRGIVAGIGHYRADWFLRFMGLESFPDYRKDGRLENYRGQPPLSNSAFKILQALVVAAAKNLEEFDRKYVNKLKLSSNQPEMLIALT